MSITDPLTNTTTITDNGYGQPLTTTDPLGNTTGFAYTAHGDLETITDPLGNTTPRAYDALSRNGGRGILFILFSLPSNADLGEGRAI